jgi:hypothetical protein
VALVEEIESQRVATTAGVQQRKDCRDNVYNVYSNLSAYPLHIPSSYNSRKVGLFVIQHNQKGEQSYLSIAAWCGDTGLITVGCGEKQ